MLWGLLVTAWIGRIGAVTKDEKAEEARALGRRVKEAREEAGLGQNELDEIVGSKGTGYTNRIEGGERSRPDGNKMRMIAEATGVALGWLMFGKGEKKPAASSSAADHSALAIRERIVERDRPLIPDFEIALADADSSEEWTQKEIAGARKRLELGEGYYSGAPKGAEARKIVKRALEEARSGAAEMRARPTTVANQVERTNALRKKK